MIYSYSYIVLATRYRTAVTCSFVFKFVIRLRILLRKYYTMQCQRRVADELTGHVPAQCPLPLSQPLSQVSLNDNVPLVRVRVRVPVLNVRLEV